MAQRHAGTVAPVHRLARFTSLICFALIVGVLVLHIPLDAFRSEAARAGGSGCCPSVAADVSDCCDDVDHAVENDAGAPVPKDGCDSGCHCGCCGGLPLAADAGLSVVVDLPGARASLLDRAGARHVQPLEVFHPPRV